MNAFRFSPIQDQEQLVSAVKYIHISCHQLCMLSFGRYIPVAGNVGIFCHFDDEYEFLTGLQAQIADMTRSVYGKYYRLHSPIVILATGKIPSATYRYLYIRKPDPNKNQVGDIDFYLEPENYTKLKQSLSDGKAMKGARVLPNRPDLDLIELYDPKIDALGYIGAKKWQQ